MNPYPKTTNGKQILKVSALMVLNKTHRFQVCCSSCGYIDSFSDLDTGIEYAQLMEIRHCYPKDKVFIFDKMAQYGNPELYNAKGEVIGIRRNVK